MNSEEAEEMTYAAIDYGYRHIDTAAVYRNEDGVGRALKRIFTDRDLERSDITITTKLWPGGLVEVDRVKNNEGTIKSLEKSLRNLDLEYVDLYLIHSPHAKGKRIGTVGNIQYNKKWGKLKILVYPTGGINHLENFNDKDVHFQLQIRLSYTHGHKSQNLLLIFARKNI